MGPQARLDKRMRLYYDKLELLNYVHDLQDQLKMEGKEAKFDVTKAVDDSLIFKLNGKVVGQEHPGVPERTSSSDLEEEENDDYYVRYIDDEGRPYMPSPEKRKHREITKASHKKRKVSK